MKKVFLKPVNPSELQTNRITKKASADLILLPIEN
jgi:hypothetical protein